MKYQKGRQDDEKSEIDTQEVLNAVYQYLSQHVNATSKPKRTVRIS